MADLLARGATLTGSPDPSVHVTRNIVFADNYWRENGAPPDGVSVSGAFPVSLEGIVTGHGDPCDGGSFNGTAHEQVHTYYHGTIDAGEDCVDGVAIQGGWYPSGAPVEQGFFFSRLGGGAEKRFERALAGLSYEHDGIVLLGGGGILVNREPVAQDGPQWANIHSISLSNPQQQYNVGDDLIFKFRYQDRDSDASVRWYLDAVPNLNPYDTPAAILGSAQTLNFTGDDVKLETATVPTTGVPPGSYRCYAKITSNNGGEPRYEYATNVLIFVTGGASPATPTISDVDPDSLEGRPLPQTQLLTITGTGFLPESRLEFHDGIEPYPNRIPIYDSPTQLRYNIKVGNVSANWTVKVLNGSLASASAAFTVTATADSTAPPAPISPVGYFAGGVNDDFYYVDWTNPTDASGLAKVWWKLGSPPTAPNDGVGFLLPDLKPLPVSTMTTNPQTLYLWLEDGAGNKDHNNRASVLLFRDTGVPFIVTPPTNRTVVEGASAIFNVLAGGAQPLAYQWQRYDTNLPGANASSYVTPPMAPADSGAQFRVIVTNAFGAVTSAWATLTVNAANTITWTGAVSSEWINRTNWSPQTVPTASDRVVVNSGTVNVQPGAAFAVMDWNGGTLLGPFTNSGTLNWTGGELWTELTVSPGGVLNLSGAENKTVLNANRIANAGTINWSGVGNLVAQGCNPGPAVLNNLAGGTLNLESDAGLAAGVSSCYGWQFNNAGLLRKTVGTGTSTLTGTFTNTGTVEGGSGIINFNNGCTQMAGSTILDGGSLSAGSPIYLNGGRLSGNGVVSAAVVNAAEVSPGGSPGLLTIVGSYTQTSAGTLNLELGGLAPGSQHDRLVVTGPVTLDGALQVSFTNGFVAGSGDFFNVLSYASRSGGFASSSAGALGLTELYTPTGLVLIAGSNAYPSLTFTVAGGPTQTVCVPFGLQASAADVDGVVTNVTILLDGTPVTSAPNSPLTTQAEIDFPAHYTFTASASDNQGGTRWVTQSVALVSQPLHVLTAGFRTNGAFKLCMGGETNRSYQLLASTNLGLTNWAVIGVMEGTNGVWRMIDGGATTQAWRFYRAEQLP